MTVTSFHVVHLEEGRRYRSLLLELQRRKEDRHDSWPGQEDLFVELSQLNGRQVKKEMNSLVSAIGSGADVASGTVSKATELVDSFRHEHEDVKGDAFEAAIAETLYMQLRGLPWDVLVEPGFWRYISLRYFSDIIFFRHPAKGSKNATPGGADPNWGLDESKLNRCVPLRIFLRGLLSKRNQDHGGRPLASVGDVDKWASHVFAQPNFACHPEMIDAQFEGFEDMINQKPPKQDEHLRKLPKRLRVVRQDIVFDSLDLSECQDIVDLEVKRFGNELKSN